MELHRMLSAVMVLARMIRQRRLKRKLTQRAVAQSLGCHQSYVTHVESGRRPCSKAMAQKLEVLLRVKRGAFSRFDFPRGRPRHSQGARQALGEIRQAVALSPEVEVSPLARPPAFPRPNRVEPRENPFWPMAVYLGERAGEEVVRLERQRAGQEGFWRLANSLCFDSWSERRLVVLLGLRCEQLLPLSLGAVGSELRGVDGMTGRDTHSVNQPGFVLRHGKASIVWFPQRCVRSRQGYRWPDGILVVSRGGRKRTVVVEIDGPRFHQNVRRGQARDRDLGVKVLHVHPAVLGQPDGLDRILDWACHF